MANRNEKKYNNLSEAVAFQIAFEFMIYAYDDSNWFDTFRTICTRCGKEEQIADFLVPKSSCKKEYGRFDTLYYGVSENIKNELINNFDITEEDFRPAYNKTGNIVYYQITPRHKMLPIKAVNRIKELKPCRKCGSVQYRMKKYKNEKGAEYYYITEEALLDMKDINVTYEEFDMFYSEVIVSRRVFDFLIKRYPRMRFVPLFLAKEEK